MGGIKEQAAQANNKAWHSTSKFKTNAAGVTEQKLHIIWHELCLQGPESLVQACMANYRITHRDDMSKLRIVSPGT